jgi:hypothetical protein
MTTSETHPVSALNTSECWGLLASTTLGPVGYQRRRSAGDIPGQLCGAAAYDPHPHRRGNQIAQRDHQRAGRFRGGHDTLEGWSVVIKGKAHTPSGSAEITEAEQAHVMPWTATPKLRYLRIVPAEISGRRFSFGAESDHFFDFG